MSNSVSSILQHCQALCFSPSFLCPVFASSPLCQMLALAVLDRILSIDRQNQWLVYVCNSGYLRSLVESLRQDDVALQSLLTPQPPLLKPLYIYESKMVRRCALKQTHYVLLWFYQAP